MIQEKRKSSEGGDDATETSSQSSSSKIAKLEDDQQEQQQQDVRNVESEIRTLKGLIPGLDEQDGDIGEVSTSWSFLPRALMSNCVLVFLFLLLFSE